MPQAEVCLPNICKADRVSAVQIAQGTSAKLESWSAAAGDASDADSWMPDSDATEVLMDFSFTSLLLAPLEDLSQWPIQAHRAA